MHPNLFWLPDWVPFLGGQPITSFGVAMFLAFLTAGLVVRHQMEEGGYDPEKAWDLLFMAVIGGIVGAKLYYVFLNVDRLQAEGISYLFSRGGMVWYGGFLLATALVVWEVRRQDLPVPTIADYAAPALALAYAVGRVGCFMVGDDWGRPTDLPWGVRFPEGAPPTTVANIEAMGVRVDPELVAQYGNVVPVHPTQIYEVLMSLAIFAVLWRLRHHAHRAGWLFMLWLSLAGGERLVVEFFRVKDDRFFGPLTLAQLISIALVAVGVWGMQRLSDRRSRGERRAAARS